MTHDLVPATHHGLALPSLFSPDAGTVRRVIDFFTANIRNPHTRKAYAKAAWEFAARCEGRGLAHLGDVEPVHVAAYVEELQARRTWVRLHEKGGKHHETPCHAAARKTGAALDPKARLFCTTEGQSGYLTARPTGQADVCRMIRRKAAGAGIETKICCHGFRATGNHESRLKPALQAKACSTRC